VQHVDGVELLHARFLRHREGRIAQDDTRRSAAQ
jgi:hypothetical protein